MRKKIAAFAGSTSTTSINKELVTFAAENLNEVEFDVLDLNDFTVPIYSQDLEKTAAYPDGASQFNKALDSYDGFMVSLAEHNGSYAAAFKNLLDWASRKNKDIFRNKPVLVLATSPGGRGGATVLNVALASFPHLGASVQGSFSLPSFYDNFDAGKIVHEEKLEELQTAITSFEKVL